MESCKGAHLQLGDLLLHLFLHGLPQAVGCPRLVSLPVHVQLSLLQRTPAAAADTCDKLMAVRIADSLWSLWQWLTEQQDRL